ncbi:MAG: indole-3-glycerol phosphate synthase TrpC [Bryobacteraceae bacterium]|jgi:indole-3-glycerol phosphate synthase
MMTANVPDILARIVDYKRAELAASVMKRCELESLAAENRAFRRDFRAALLGRTPAIIAEIKKASPSKGVLVANDFDPGAIALEYEAGGAAALSVVTDEKFFQGSFDDLDIARGAVHLPVLRKDFIFDEHHVAESAARCADAILLLAAILPAPRLRQLREYAARFGLAALVEVHDETELASALDSGAQLIGVNNRNLHTFEVNLDTSVRLAPLIPAGIVKVSESGIRSAEDVCRLQQAGFQAFLIGEHLMRSKDRRHALQNLFPGTIPRPKPPASPKQ